MKNSRKNFILRLPLLLLFVFLSSCSRSFLEVVPPGRLIAESTSEYSSMLSSADLILSGAGYGAPINMGDDVSGLEPYFSAASVKAQGLFRWDADVYLPDENPSELNFLTQLYVVNKVINEVPQSTGGTDAEKASIIAEARANRAFYYFMAINLFAKPYNAATAATDPGFPIITQADVTQTAFPDRASVQQVYDFILADLTEAIPDLPALVPFAARMSRPAAQGLLGKVYVYMQNFTAALPMLNSCITDIGSIGGTIPIELYDYNVTMGAEGSFLPIDPIFGVTYPLINNNREAVLWRVTNSAYAGYWGSFSGNTGGELVLSQKARALYLSSDLRLNFFQDTFFGSAPFPAGLVRRSAPTQNVLLNLPDMYLFRAECKARLNDLAGAREDVEFLRARRMPAADVPVSSAIASAQDDLIRFIIDERVREFAFTGLSRWFDMRRLSLDPLFSNEIYTHILYPETGLSTGATTYTLTEPRFTLRIPPRILSQNPGMTDNP